jgi:Zn-dependent protease with chaperone function
VAFGAGALVGVTAAIFWYFPIWIGRRLQLTPFAEADAPELAAELARLCAVAGLKQAPRFLWNVLDASPRALAYGRGKDCRIGLTGGIVGQFYTQPDVFRAVILHELAHIRNGDIVKTYLTVAVWWAFVATALVPQLLVDLWDDHGWGNCVIILLRTVRFAGIVLITRNAVLRARELYADVRASAWQGQGRGLEIALRTLRPIPRLWRWISVHPDPARRRQLLHSTEPLFRTGAWELFGIGAAAGVAILTLTFIVGLLYFLILGDAESMALLVAQMVMPALLVSTLAAAAVAVIVWRATFVSVVRFRRQRRAVWTAFPLTGGATFGLAVFYGFPFLEGAVGDQYGLQQIVVLEGVSVPALLLGATAVIGAAFLLLVGALSFYLSWVQSCARAWLPVALGQNKPGTVFRIGIGVAAITAILWFSYLPFAFVSAVAFPDADQPASVFGKVWLLLTATDMFPFSVVAWVSAVAVWGYPMAAAVKWPRRGTGPASWAYLDPAPAVTLKPPLQPRQALLIGLAGGIAGGVVLSLTKFDVPASVLSQVHLPQTALGARFLTALATAIVAQVLTGVVAALAIRKLAFVHAMFAAFVAGWLLFGAECLSILIRLKDVPAVWEVIGEKTVIGGAIATILPAAVAAALIAAFTQKTEGSTEGHQVSQDI